MHAEPTETFGSFISVRSHDRTPPNDGRHGLPHPLQNTTPGTTPGDKTCYHTGVISCVTYGSHLVVSAATGLSADLLLQGVNTLTVTPLQ